MGYSLPSISNMQFQPHTLQIISTLFALFLFIIPVCLFLTRKKPSVRLPPGSLGLPLIGHSVAFLRAMRANTAEDWLEQRSRKYGHVSKMSLFGKPTVFMHGQAANKFIFSSDESTISSKKTESTRRILGHRNLFELDAEDHKRVRNALMLFLKPESLKQYVGKIDEEIRKHIKEHWQGKKQITVMPLMKELTLNLVSTQILGLEDGTSRGEFLECLRKMLQGMYSVPVNLPFTRYHRSLKASGKVQEMVTELVREKRVQLAEGMASPKQDLITCFLSIRNDEGEEELTELEMVQNIVLVMVAAYDTTSVLLTFLLRLLANEPTVYDTLLQEQEEIARSKSAGDLLTWEDLTKMKYTWRVAQETLRMTPPAFGGFRTVMKDIEFGGFLIPKGWQIFWAAPMTHMDDSIFPEPTKFDPSRFDKQANEATVPPFTFVPFGGGRRICAGYEFARIECLIAIHYIVTQYTWKLCADNHYSRDLMPTPTKGLPIEITIRTRM